MRRAFGVRLTHSPCISNLQLWRNVKNHWRSFENPHTQVALQTQNSGPEGGRLRHQYFIKAPM